LSVAVETGYSLTKTTRSAISAAADSPWSPASIRFSQFATVSAYRGCRPALRPWPGVAVLLDYSSWPLPEIKKRATVL
jgi:hypothetical protein